MRLVTIVGALTRKYRKKKWKKKNFMTVWAALKKGSLEPKIFRF